MLQAIEQTSPAFASDADIVEERYQAKLRRELGPVLIRELGTETTEDLLLNPDGRLWVKRRGEPFQVLAEIRAAQAMGLMSTIASRHQTVVNIANPILEAELPFDGSRFEGLVPPVVSGPTFAIRKRATAVYTLDQYERSSILTDASDPRNGERVSDGFLQEVAGLRHADVIRTAIRLRKNILVVGSTGSGKTTLVNAVLDGIAAISPDDRVLLIEDTPELQCAVANCVRLLASGNVTMLDCLRACMRLKPTRIVVGEVRGAEALTMLKAWNTGHPGGAATVHANDALSGLTRLESLVAEATAAPQQRLIAEAVDVVVFIDGAAGGAGRKVKEVCIVKGYEEGKYLVHYV